MAKLVSVENLRIRMGLQDTESTNLRLAAAIEAATVHLESLLETSLDYQATDDTFWIDPREQPWVDHFLYVRLSKGFVDSTVPPVLRLAGTVAEAPTADPLATSNTKFNYKGGLAAILDSDLVTEVWPRLGVDEVFLRVEYSYGFQTKSDEFGKVYLSTPAWLQEAAYVIATNIYRGASPCGDSIPKDCVGCASIVNFITPHLRFFPYARNPVV